MCKLNQDQRYGLREVLSKYAFPGGYQINAIMSDGAMLCSGCVQDNLRIIAESTAGDFRDDWTFAGAEIYYEGPTEYCAHCGAEIKSEYGDPWANENEEVAA